MPLTSVLVATDLTPGGTRAIARAARLPLAPGARLAILHVLPEGSDPKVDRLAEADARRALDVAAAAVAQAREVAREPRVEVHVVVRRGKPFVEVIRCARETGAELVVIGRHRRRFLRSLFIGSTAERVVRKGSTPVLVVNQEARGPYLRPLVALDLSETSERALDLALRLIHPGDRRARPLDVVHAYQMPFEGVLQRAEVRVKQVVRRREQERRKALAAIDQTLALLTREGVEFKAILREGDPRRVIRDQSVRRRSDLVALGTRGRTGLAYMLLGSVAEAVVREAPCDVLVARPERIDFELP